MEWRDENVMRKHNVRANKRRFFFIRHVEAMERKDKTRKFFKPT
jgi:hypothetical protein